MTLPTVRDGSEARLARRPDIPPAAWSRPIGVGLPAVGRAIEANFPMVDDGCFQGSPLGGLGSGSIGRTFRGDFARWHLEPGVHRYETVYSDQFSIYVEQGDQKVAQVLFTGRPEGLLSSWQWDYPRGAGSYHALFPRAWFEYDWDRLPVRLTQEQFSPVIPGNYRESSYPVAIFEWTVENPSPEPIRLGLMFTWENFVGRPPVASYFKGEFRSAATPGRDRVKPRNVARREAGVVGMEMLDDLDLIQGPHDGSIAIAAGEVPGVDVSYRSFAVDESGSDVWKDFASDGRLDESGEPYSSERGLPIAAALAVTFDLGPGETKTVPFALAWDFPLAQFPGGQAWHKRYARFFGATGANAWKIAVEGLAHYEEWRDSIEAWQRPILDDPGRPDWYKTALFNELYYLVDGGTLWGDPVPAIAEQGDVGLFGYLECFDYPFYGTLDVAFYSSWAQLLLWPKLERQEIVQFSETVEVEDSGLVHLVATRDFATRKVASALPHDLGAPFENPLLRANAYSYQDPNLWKDLNLKYVLRAYRDYLILDDRQLLERLWPTIVAALDYLRRFDDDGDGLLDHHGADQTYDNWSMEGASAYTGSLLIATLEAASEMARIVGQDEARRSYREWLSEARNSFQGKLWNGSYFLYNTGSNRQRDTVMADQLAGQWYAGALGLPAVAMPDQIRSALRMVFQHNVIGFAGGTMGAVNAVRPDGSPDESDLQAQEVWSGVTYALAALMLQEGLDEEAWRTAWGAYNTTYVTHGFWFRTPEAWYQDGTFRAGLYMRPQSIWAIEHALRHRQR